MIVEQEVKPGVRGDNNVRPAPPDSWIEGK